ncbi:Programmed cell death toxin YdcE [Bacillus thermotolerans]|nr:Programmed cell death toxin YdcE [Bacillus thermotolerans]
MIVASITNKITEPKLPTHIKLSQKKYGMESDYIVLLEQIRTISKTRLIKKIGSINELELEQLDEAWCFTGGVGYSHENRFEVQTKDYFEFFLDEEVMFLEESRDCEFKSPLDFSSVNEIRVLIDNKIMEYVVSFLNSNGGSIFFGISDKKIVKGLELSYKDRDEIALSINSKIRDRLEPKISVEYHKIRWHSVKDKDKNDIDNLFILEVEIKKPFDPLAIYFDRGKTLYIKTDTGRQKYTKPADMVSIIMKRAMENGVFINHSLKNKKDN